MAEYAGLGGRIVAAIIDMIILWVVMAVLAIPLGLQTMAMGTSVMDLGAYMASMTLYSMVAGIVSLLYFIYFEGSRGQTPGKMALSIKVVKEDGKAITFVDALIRTILRIVDGLPGFYILGLILVAVTEKKQRLGDMAAKTIVVKA